MRLSPSTIAWSAKRKSKRAMRVSYMRFSKSGKTFQTGLKTASRSTALLKPGLCGFRRNWRKPPRRLSEQGIRPDTRYDQRAGDGRAQRQGKQARQYFIECERRAKAIIPFAIPQTLPEALRLAADLAEQNRQLEAKNEAMV